MRKRCWLIYSYFANIDGKAASQHIDDRLSRLKELGVDPVLVSSICAERRKDFPHFRVPSAAPSGIRFELRYVRRRGRLLNLLFFLPALAVLPFYFLEKLLIGLDSQWSWFPSAFLRGLAFCAKERPELVYSTGGPVSAHVAAAMLSRLAGIAWIAELQDPLVYGDFSRGGQARKVNAWVESLIFRKASAVIFLTEAAKKSARSRHREAPAPAFAIHPGAAPPQVSGVSWSRGEHCRFSHFGSLGGTRNLQVFLDALARVLSGDPALAGIVRLDLYGTVDRASRRLIADFKYPGVISDRGKVSRLDAVRAMRQSDVLVMIHNRDDSAPLTIPAKFYDYILAGRPILGLVYKNAELRSILERCGHFAAEADSPDETASGIVELIERWKRQDLAGPGGAAPFTVEAAARALVEIAEKIRPAGLRACS